VNPPSSVVAIVLAAGLGTRMRSRTPKILHLLSGRPMLAHVLDVADAASRRRPLVVYSPATEAVCETFADRASFALQEVPRGTGDALHAALDALAQDASEALVLSGDTPLLRSETIAALAEQRRADGAVMTLTTFRPEEPRAYGRVVLQGGDVIRIVERKDATPDELAIEDMNAGLYAFDVAWVRERIGALTPSPVTGELYLTQLVELARADGRRVTAYALDDELEALGVDDRVQLATAEAELRWRITERHMLAGVTVEDPLAVYIGAEVELAQDVVVEPGVVLRGRTRVGSGSRLGAGSQLIDSTVGARSVVWASVLESAVVGDDVTIGPFSHLRPGALVEAGAQIGNFAEIKKSRLGPRSKQHHFSYLGDADVGADVNIGAGTITANFDGRRKHRTTIGDRAFIGSDTILRAPITVGDDALTGAGSVVTKDVPPGKIAVGVPARIREPRRKPDDEPPGA
jgi:bifunctional UDP-N-acetylglucosamine pyrophosphorylase/glucosamine-1-phosphate N-acetyltransferase